MKFSMEYFSRGGCGALRRRGRGARAGRPAPRRGAPGALGAAAGAVGDDGLPALLLLRDHGPALGDHRPAVLPRGGGVRG